MKDQFNLFEVTPIRYTKIGSGEQSIRDVIPTFVPNGNMTAIDVTDASPEERAAISKLISEYTEYYKTVSSRIFSFEDWLEHTSTRSQVGEIKWRTFKLGNTERL